MMNCCCVIVLKQLFTAGSLHNLDNQEQPHKKSLLIIFIIFCYTVVNTLGRTPVKQYPATMILTIQNYATPWLENCYNGASLYLVHYFNLVANVPQQIFYFPIENFQT